MPKNKTEIIDENSIVKRVRRIQKLLKRFGVQGYAFDPGVRCFATDHVSTNGGGWIEWIDFDGPTWKFIEPLLRELVKYRNAYGADMGKRKASKKTRNVS